MTAPVCSPAGLRAWPALLHAWQRPMPALLPDGFRAPVPPACRYHLPLAELGGDFYDELKSVSSGYASFDYEEAEYRCGTGACRPCRPGCAGLNRAAGPIWASSTGGGLRARPRNRSAAVQLP